MAGQGRIADGQAFDLLRGITREKLIPSCRKKPNARITLFWS
jgi:hypothetical protein